MSEQPLLTLKEVAQLSGRQAHRIIHLCEVGVVCPTENPQGRGRVRRFSREDVFRVLLALNLQDAGMQAPLIRPLMDQLDCLLEVEEIQHFRDVIDHFDLVSVIGVIGSQKQPVLAWLTPPDQVALVAPRLKRASEGECLIDVHLHIEPLIQRGVSIVANLTMMAAKLSGKFFLTF